MSATCRSMLVAGPPVTGRVARAADGSSQVLGKESAMTDTPSPPVAGPTIRPPRPRRAPKQGTTGTTPPRGGSEPARRVGPGFIVLYTLAFLSTSLLFLAPLLVTLALKVNWLVGTERAPNSLSLVASIGGLLSIVANPFFGRLSDRTSSCWGMRRPWMVVGLLGGDRRDRSGARHRRRPRRVVHRPGLLQRAARR
jgi:MFS/sugar transport protein